MITSKPITALALATLGAAVGLPHSEPGSPPEFGAVKWGRELEPALEASAKGEKPVLLLFQEVPG